MSNKLKDKNSSTEVCVPEKSMFEKFQRALEMDEKGAQRTAIINELDISSATFYKWIKNPNYWSQQYKAKPENLQRTTKEVITSLRKKESSIETVRGLLKDLDLNEYELEFMYNYIEQRNSTEALLRTLPPNMEISRQAAKIKATKLMQRKKIREGIDRILQWELEGIHVTLANDIIGTLYRMAFYDPSMFIDGTGKSRFKSLDDIPKEYRCCVVGIKPTFHPKDATKVYYELKLADKQVALKELRDYANLYGENTKSLKSIGEGLKKVGALIAANKVETVPLENVTPPGSNR